MHHVQSLGVWICFNVKFLNRWAQWLFRRETIWFESHCHLKTEQMGEKMAVSRISSARNVYWLKQLLGWYKLFQLSNPSFNPTKDPTVLVMFGDTYRLQNFSSLSLFLAAKYFFKSFRNLVLQKGLFLKKIRINTSLSSDCLSLKY